MDMDVMLFKVLFLKLISQIRTDKGQSGLCRLLHHIAKLTGQGNTTFSRHHIYFNLKGIAAHTGPGKASHQTNLRFLFYRIRTIFTLSQIGRQFLFRNLNRKSSFYICSIYIPYGFSTKFTKLLL